ncbi:MAG: T9SS type A sorting domain-containing protein, partial [Bacteroidota bacterium]
LNENEERWKIYPNPAKEFILIDLYTEEKGTYDIRLLDMMGRVSSGMQIEMGRASGKTYVMSVQDIAEGVYFLEIRHGNALMRKKISVE